MKSTTKSKLKIGIPVIIVAIVLGLTIPCFAMADVFPTAAEIASSILEAIVGFSQGLFSTLVRMGAAFFEGMLELGFKKSANIDTINIGWQTARDLANMLFILFMIIIAFATILRIEGYGIKKLLPKVIIIALLINFSMVFCKIIIDFSNITANFFIQNIKSTLNGKSMTATFVDSLNLTKIQLSFADCNADENFNNCSKTYVKPEDQNKYDCYNLEPGNQPLIDCCHTVRENNSKCATMTATALEAQSAARKDWTGVLNILISGIVGSILLLIAAFTLFAGAIMLLFRILAIWFLVMIVPLVFICYIMPGLQNNWKKWWSTFLNWCIFAPAYSFFIWLAIKICVENANLKLATSVNSTLTQFIGGVGNPFIQNPGEQLLGYAIIIGLLIGGLIVAKSLGIYGANTVMNIATSAKKGATGWLQRQAMRPVTATGSKIGAGTLGLTGRLFGGKIGGRMQAKAVQIKQARTQTVDNKNFANLTKTMTDDALLEEIENGIGPRKLIATQTAMSRGLLAKTSNRNSIKKAIKTLEGYGMKKEAGDIRNSRPDAADDINKTVESVLSKDEQGVWRESAFEPEEGKEIIKAMIKFCGNNVTMFREKFNKLNGLAKKKAIEQMKKMFTDDFTDVDNLMVRQRYAAITGNVYDSFKNSTGSVPAGHAAAEMEKFIRGMKPSDFTGLDPQSAVGIAPYIDASMAKEILKYISINTRKDFGDNLNQAVKEELMKDDKWRPYLQQKNTDGIG
jgi:hypothetical protein